MPSDILLSTGFPNVPIELVASRLVDKSMQENHPFELKEVENLPASIHNPLAVFRSATHVGSFVILTELKYVGRSFVAAIEANKQVGKLIVNSIRSVHYRTGLNIVNWINEDLGEYYTPGFIAKWLNPLKNELRSKPQYNSVDVRTKLNSAANVIENSENPKISTENFREGDDTPYMDYDAELKESRQRGYTRKQFDEMLERHVRRMRNRVEMMSEKLNTPIKIIDDVDSIIPINPKIQERRRKAMGWYDVATGKSGRRTETFL